MCGRHVGCCRDTGERVWVGQYTVRFSFQNALDKLTFSNQLTCLNAPRWHSNSNGREVIDWITQDWRRHWRNILRLTMDTRSPRFLFYFFFLLVLIQHNPLDCHNSHLLVIYLVSSIESLDLWATHLDLRDCLAKGRNVNIDFGPSSKKALKNVAATKWFN